MPCIWYDQDPSDYARLGRGRAPNAWLRRGAGGLQGAAACPPPWRHPRARVWPLPRRSGLPTLPAHAQCGPKNVRRGTTNRKGSRRSGRAEDFRGCPPSRHVSPCRASQLSACETVRPSLRHTSGTVSALRSCLYCPGKLVAVTAVAWHCGRGSPAAVDVRERDNHRAISRKPAPATMVSRPRELPPRPLAEPCVNLAIHTAPIVRPSVTPMRQWTNRCGSR